MKTFFVRMSTFFKKIFPHWVMLHMSKRLTVRSVDTKKKCPFVQKAETVILTVSSIENSKKSYEVKIIILCCCCLACFTSAAKAASSKQQAASSKQQAASSKQQAASSKQQAASSKQQAVSRQQGGFSVHSAMWTNYKLVRFCPT